MHLKNADLTEICPPSIVHDAASRMDYYGLMTSVQPIWNRESPAFAPGTRGHAIGQALSRRMELLGAQPPAHAHKPPLRLFLSESLSVFEPALRKMRDPLVLPNAKTPQVVILLPGFGTHPVRMRYMAERLESAGHTVKNWGLGFNFGPSEENFAILRQRLLDVHQRYGRKVMLVGWSLGGIFGRELAKLHPEAVARVITMGSPFSHTPYSNNVWRIYHLVTGHSVEHPPLVGDMSAKPPVETVALWSPRDGVVSARSACGRPGERDRAIALRCSHMGFSNSPEAIRTVARELDRDRA
jgi:pimeloyl-ACP methyl ester carboxylesterase